MHRSTYIDTSYATCLLGKWTSLLFVTTELEWKIKVCSYYEIYIYCEYTLINFTLIRQGINLFRYHDFPFLTFYWFASIYYVLLMPFIVSGKVCFWLANGIISIKITSLHPSDLLYNIQKQPSRGVLRKRCSENM